MVSLRLVYLIVSAILFGIGVVVHYNSVSLSLPIPTAISILTPILPIAGFLNAYVYPSSASNSRLRPIVLQVLQALVTTVLATLLLEGVIPTQGLHCVLENRWSSLFRAHDANSIRHIQDRFDCCGLNSIRDRAYPFPHTSPSTCADTYGRNIACVSPWTAAMQGNAGADFAVVIATGLLQIFGLLMMSEGTGWLKALRPRNLSRSVSQPESSRRLLGDQEHHDEEHGQQQRQNRPSSYRAIEEYEDSPRVEPSTIHDPNPWKQQRRST